MVEEHHHVLSHWCVLRLNEIYGYLDNPSYHGIDKTVRYINIDIIHIITIIK